MSTERDSAQTVIDQLLAENVELKQEVEYERTIRDLVEAERDEWKARARVLEGQLRLKVQDARYVVGI